MRSQSWRAWRTTRAATLKNASRSRLPRQRRNSRGRTWYADPAGDVVGEGAGVPPQPVPEEVLDRGVDEPEVFLELTDGVFGDPAAQPVMGLDHVGGCEQGGQVRDDGMEPPPVEIVEGQLVPGAGALAAHDQPQPSPVLVASPDLDGGLGDLRSLLALRRPAPGPTPWPHRRRGRAPRPAHWTCFGAVIGEHGAEGLAGGEHVVLVAGRVDPHPQVHPLPAPRRGWRRRIRG